MPCISSGAIKKLNPVMTEVIEQLRSKGWRVSRLRQKLPGHNEKKGQTAANKRAADARDLAINIERVLSSDQEAATYAATSGKPLTRAQRRAIQFGHKLDENGNIVATRGKKG